MNKRFVWLVAIVLIVCGAGARADSVPVGANAIDVTGTISFSYDNLGVNTFSVATFANNCLANCQLSFRSADLSLGQAYYVIDDKVGDEAPGALGKLGPQSLDGSWNVALFSPSSSYSFYFDNGGNLAFDSVTFSGDFCLGCSPSDATNVSLVLPTSSDSTPVPEPGSILLLSSGLIVLASRFRKKI